MNGIINVYKEPGFTSHDVVAKLRGILKQKKIGHTGTLDPDAAGVLPVCLGNATRVCDLLTDETKEYEALLRLGVTTDTYDLSGRILSEEPEKAGSVTKEDLENVLRSFTGTIDQIPPMYSAIKVGGKKLYELARKGIEVERKARSVRIEKLELLSGSAPLFRLRIVCSKGTYIRSLCHDIGQTLGCGGAMAELLRTRVGGFCVDDAVKLSVIEEKIREMGRIPEELSDLGLGNAALSVDRLFCGYGYSPVRTKEEYDKLLHNGNPLREEMIVRLPADFEKDPDPGNFRVYDSRGLFLGIYGYGSGQKVLYPVKLFLQQ